MVEIQEIDNVLRKALPITAVGEAIILPTHCLFPGGRSVVITIRSGHGGDFTLTDDTQAYSVIKEAGVELNNHQIAKAHVLAKSYGADFHQGSFVLSGVPISRIAGAVIVLANLSQFWASEIIGNHQAAKNAALKVRVYNQLHRIFPSSVEREFVMHGQSTKDYRFDYRVKISDSNYLLVDAVSNHPNSISSAFLRNYDVKNIIDQSYKQEAVIEDKSTWKSEDLVVLGKVFDGIIPIETNLVGLQKYASSTRH